MRTSYNKNDAMLKEGFAGEHFQGYGNNGAEISVDGGQRVMRKMGKAAQNANEQELYDSESAYRQN